MRTLFFLSGGLRRLRALALALLVVGAATGVHAQNAVGGLVKDAETGEALISVTVAVSGSSTGTVTGIDGRFELNAAANDTLVVSYVGYATQRVPVAGQRFVNITLSPDRINLREVTVTALGISREKKSLGYAVQEVGGGSLDKARETNLVSALAGKVAGLTIVGNPSGIGSSARVTIRGERSLNINNNQPLFVVDGVPISNQLTGSTGRGNQDADFGNGAGFINPDDIENVTVLKGASAAALYGSRANNGVILITTKTGKGTRGLGVSVNSTLSFEDPLRLPDYQNKYGQGLNGEFSFLDGFGGGNKDGVDESWGPEMIGQDINQFNSPTTNGFRAGDVGNLYTPIGPVDKNAQLAARGDIIATPFNPQPNNISDFFETGVTQTHNIAIAGSNERSDVRLSYTWMDQKGMVPNTDLRRNTVGFSGGYKLSDRLSVRAVANYINNTSGNRPNLSYGTENIMYLFNCWFPRNTAIAPLRDYWQAGREDLNQFNFNYNYHDNPYFNLYENTNSQDIDRVYGNFSVNYKITPHLNLMLRSGTDVSNEFRARRRAYSTQRFLRGSYREENIYFAETNSDALLTYDKPLSKDLSFTLSAGGNLMRQQVRSSDVSAPELAVPGVYTLGNSRVALQSSTFQSEKRINSLYASSQLGFRDYLFLDLSLRNDWSSTLPESSRSYLYYGANLGFVVSEFLGIDPAGTLSFAKLRLGLAQVGNDTDPYQLAAVFNPVTPVQGQPAYGESSVLVNPDLKPEISTSFETGADLRFFRNRVGLDATYYRTESRNQILPIPLSGTTGYSARIINAGRILNQGVELTLSVNAVRTRDFSWDIGLNWSRNRSKVIELYTDPVSGEKISSYVMASRYITVEAREGEQMGAMYGIGYERVSSDPSAKYYDPTGEFVGQVVYTSQGKPIATTNRILLGNYNPDWLAGISNTFTFKGLSLGVLFDMRMGGQVYSHTQTVGREGGIISETLEGRANGYDLNVEGNGVIGEGVLPIVGADGKITGYTPNAVKLSAREWHSSITLGRRVVEPMTYDATFVKLREVRLGYAMPNRIFGRLPIRDMNISVVARNLALWTEVPHIDPETSSTSGGVVIPGVESVALPSARSIGMNLNFKF